MTPPKKACDHLNCQQASAETTNCDRSSEDVSRENVSPTRVSELSGMFSTCIFANLCVSNVENVKVFCIHDTLI